MRPQSLFALLLALFALGSAVAAEPWPEIPPPPEASVQWVGDNMRINGVPTRVMQFQSKVSRVEIAAYYRAYWSGGYPTKPSVTPMGAATTLISQRHGPYFMTVKVNDAERGSSQGLISVAQVAGIQVKLDPGELPLMPGARILSVVESDDPGKHSRQVALLAEQPTSSLTQFYVASLTNSGWQQVQATESPGSAGAAPGSFVVFAKDRSEMQLSFTALPEGRGSALVANLVTKDTGRSAQ